jgi:hypothetical protein
MSKSSNITFATRDRGDGTWYVEIMRPGIVCEHVGFFRSELSAQTWIQENKHAYAKRESAHVRSKHRRSALQDHN